MLALRGPLRALALAFVAVTCSGSVPTPSVPAASQAATIVLSPSPPRTCETTQIEAQVAVATTTATVIATCLTCSGRFPPPSPGVAPITVEAKLSLVSQGTFRGEIVFPRGGTWRFDSPDLPLPVTRPTVQVVPPAAPSSCS